MPKGKSLIVAIFTLTILAGCGAPNPASYGSNWKPVHAYTTEVQKTPLIVPHIYKPHPSDANLRGLLTRWSQEAGASLDYASSYEFSLVVHVNSIQNKSLNEALKDLQAVYRPHGVEITWKRNTATIVVRDSSPEEQRSGVRKSKNQ